MRFQRMVTGVFIGAAAIVAGCGHASQLTPSVSSGPGSGPVVSSLAQAGASPSRSAPQTITMLHVQTWQQLQTGDGNRLSSWSQAAPWLTYANTTAHDSTAMHAAGIKTAFYTNPNRQIVNGPMYTSDETTFAHDCSGHRIQGSNLGNPWLMEPHHASLRTLWKQYVNGTIANGAVFDYIFEDNADTMNKLPTMPCGWTQPDWTAATNGMDAALGKPIIYNSLSNTSTVGGVPAVAPSFALNPTAVGGMAEDCYVTHETKPRYYLGWQAMENTEIGMAAAGKLFVCNGGMSTNGGSSIPMRIYQYASYMLTYDPNTTIYESHFTTPKGLFVFPEVQLVARQPLLPQPVNIAVLLQTGGTYARRYGACYFHGNLVGPCAAVVNSNQTYLPNAPFPFPGVYHHTLSLSGTGVLDGGGGNTSGPAPPSSMAGGTAVIAF